MQKERANFHFRCNLLKSFALLQLQEINDNTLLISDAFEQWIIAAVKKENSVASQVIKVLEAEVKSDAAYLDNIKVQHSELESCIQRVKLDEGLPQYLRNFEPPRSMEATRLPIETLSVLFNQFKKHAHQELLDTQTFITLMIQNFQAHNLPKRWRSASFQSILSVIAKFAQKPLGNLFSEGRSPFASSMGMDNDRKEFLNWKRVYLLFALAASEVPSDEQLDAYGAELAKYGTLVSKEDFQDVSKSW